jgi:hypothetical protein
MMSQGIIAWWSLIQAVAALNAMAESISAVSLNPRRSIMAAKALHPNRSAATGLRP